MRNLHILICLFMGFGVCSCPQVSLVLSALQAGNKGTQACITAASAVSGIIADLDTTIMFASAGTLNAENDESFADHRLELEIVFVPDYVCLHTRLWEDKDKSWLEPKIYPLVICHLKLTEWHIKLWTEAGNLLDYKLPSGFERCAGSVTFSAVLVLRLRLLLWCEKTQKLEIILVIFFLIPHCVQTCGRNLQNDWSQWNLEHYMLLCLKILSLDSYRNVTVPLGAGCKGMKSHS